MVTTPATLKGQKCRGCTKVYDSVPAASCARYMGTPSSNEKGHLGCHEKACHTDSHELHAVRVQEQLRHGICAGLTAL